MFHGQPEYTTRVPSYELVAFFDETARLFTLSARVARDPSEKNISALRRSLERVDGATNALDAAERCGQLPHPIAPSNL